MKKRVLVTAIGTATATAIVKILKDHGDFFIIGADTNEQNMVATSLDVDEFYKFPLAAEGNYITFVLDFCEKNLIEYYYAVIDTEVVDIVLNREKFLAIGTKLCLIDNKAVEICHYKNRFGKWIEDNFAEVAISEYRTPAEVKKARYPLFVKPIEGVASKGCRRIDNYKELTVDDSVNQIGKSIIVQQYIEGVYVTVDCIRNRMSNQIILLQRKELLRNSNGCGIAVEIINDMKLDRICRSILEKLDINGVVNMEFIISGNDYKIIEVNPRFSAGTYYSYMAGVNTVISAMNIADGSQCEICEIKTGAHFAERYEAYRTDKNA